MYERRWPYFAAGAAGVIVVAVVAWAAGRATAPDRAAQARERGDGGGAVRLVDGVAIGVEHSQAGALAAADNYVARAAETIVQDPRAFSVLVKRVWLPEAQPRALADAKKSRHQAPDAVANYEAGGRALALPAARKLENYDADRATVLSWGAGFVWGPDKRPTQRWFLARLRLVWAGGQWSVASLDELRRPAPTPYRVIVGRPDADSAAVFDEVLDGMSTPVYGTAGASR